MRAGPAGRIDHDTRLTHLPSPSRGNTNFWAGGRRVDPAAFVMATRLRRAALQLIRREASRARVRVQLRFRDRGAEPRVRHFDARADAHRVEQPRHIAGAHPDAAEARRPADESLFRGAVNINITRVSPRVLLFQ